MYVMSSTPSNEMVMFTLPVASIGAVTVMFTSVPLAIIPMSETVMLIVEATLLTLKVTVSLKLSRYWSSPT